MAATISERLPLPDMESPIEPSKRDKRRAKESKKKAEAEAQKLAFKEARNAERKARAKGDTTAQQNEKLRRDRDFVVPKRKGKPKAADAEAPPFAEEKIIKAVETVEQYREKLLDKWGDNWTSELSSELESCEATWLRIDYWLALLRLYQSPDERATPPSNGVTDLHILCLGLGKPFSDRSAQIQLALLLELSSRLQVGRYTHQRRGQMLDTDCLRSLNDV